MTVVGSPGVVSPGPVSSEASCPAGQQPIGGGFRTTGPAEFRRNAARAAFLRPLLTAVRRKRPAWNGGGVACRVRDCQ